DAGVDLLADRETLGALLVTVARQIGALDEALDVVVDEADFQPAVLHAGDFAGHDGILAQFARGGRLADRIAAELLDAERDALLLDIDVEDLGLNHVAAVVFLDDLLAGAAPVEV